MSNQEYTLAFPVRAGMLVRGQLRTALKLAEATYRNSVKVEYSEEKGFTESTFAIIITGPRDKVHAAKDYLKRMADW